ncbi:DUF2180 family protein [Streptomyces scabiei]|uniref:DUF2180 family protein n=1 Tax=Streptomyces scabiei TaxID=1930 RepID=UPI0038F66E1A
MQCYDCLVDDHATTAVAVCSSCGAALCRSMCARDTGRSGTWSAWGRPPTSPRRADSCAVSATARRARPRRRRLDTRSRITVRTGRLPLR